MARIEIALYWIKKRHVVDNLKLFDTEGVPLTREDVENTIGLIPLQMTADGQAMIFLSMVIPEETSV